MLDEGVLATTVPNKAQPLRVRLACGESHLGPPGTSLGHSVAEPPELSRLKCAGHHHKGNTSSNALQTEQFLVCRVTSRYNHRFSDRTSIPRTKASPEILQPQVLYHKHKSYYKLVLKHYYKYKLKKKTVIQTINLTSEFESSRKRQRRLQHVAKVYQVSPSKVSLITVIAGRRCIPLYGPARRQRAWIGQASDLILKSHTWKRGFNSKAEYSNTQQDLTVNGYK